MQRYTETYHLCDLGELFVKYARISMYVKYIVNYVDKGK